MFNWIYWTFNPNSHATLKYGWFTVETRAFWCSSSFKLLYFMKYWIQCLKIAVHFSRYIMKTGLGHFVPGQFVPGHFVPGHFVQRTFRPRTFRPRTFRPQSALFCILRYMCYRLDINLIYFDVLAWVVNIISSDNNLEEINFRNSIN